MNACLDRETRIGLWALLLAVMANVVAGLIT